MPTMQQVLTAARAKMLADTRISSLVGTDIGKDPNTGLFKDGWIFKSNDNGDAPLRDVANSGTGAVVMSLWNPALGPNRHNTLKMRELNFTIWADQSRTPGAENLTKSLDADLRCDRIASALFDVFHDAGNVDHWWPGNIYIVSCTAWNDFKVMGTDNKDGLVEGNMSFVLELA